MKLEIKKGVLFSTLSSINKDKKSLLYIVFIDALFLLSLFILGQVFNALSFSIGAQQLFKALSLAILYYAALIFIYSFFKYIVLHFIKSSLGKNKLEFNRLGKFYLLNIAIFVILFLVFFLLSLLAASIKAGIAPYSSLIILLLYSVFAYAFVNISHVVFYEGKNIGKSLQLGAGYLGKVNSYYGIYLVIAAAFAITFLLFSIFGNLLKITLFQDYNSLLRYGDIYTIVFVHGVGIIFYLAIVFNRFYFYNIVKEKFLK
ncbi:hypothetical protein HYU09_00055 [Candidatus Woesearchaeota archaeon]|nr:hypothetical protein [Candidatus Woesearchaeota archaeon]